ncbi:MAG: hypothetical protein CMJ31_11685, partial [Phycisphaerae bacterium]|nr:hypothetical protein [Phycisphaerae bacterium]
MNASDQAPEPRMRFQFSEAPFGQVIDLFSRRFELPVIREADAPKNSMTFISAEDYTLNEALEILNLNLAPHGMRLSREENFLYLRSLSDAARKAMRVTDFSQLDGIDPTQYVSVTVPLNNAIAATVAEQVRPLLKEPGMVTAVQAQNMVVLVETAAQARRLRDVIQRIDDVRPVDSEYKVFRLEHAEPKNVVGALKGLVGQRIQKQIIEKDGSVRQVEEVDLAGLSIEPDERTNSIIAVGSSSRLETVEELVALLDMPEGGMGSAGESALQTFPLETVTPNDAKRQIEALFKGMPEKRRPTVLALDEVGKVVVVGEQGLIARAAALIEQLDPNASDAAANTSSTATVIELEHISPSEAEQVARRMLSPRQAQMVKTAPAPSGDGLLATGPSADIEALRALVEAIDVAADTRREITRLSIDPASRDRVLAEATRLDALTDEATDEPVEVLTDANGGGGTLIGSREAVRRFESRVRLAEETLRPALERRELSPEHMRPSDLASALRRLADSVLRDPDDRSYRAPDFQPIDELGVLVVRATPDQLDRVASLADTLDAPGLPELRVIDLDRSDKGSSGAIERAKSLYAEQAPLATPGGLGPVRVDMDTAAGKAIVRGPRDGVQLFDRLLRDARSLTAPQREPRLYTIRQTDAEGVIPSLRAMLEQAGPIDPARDAASPTIETAAGVDNTLRVVADPAQHARIAEFIRLLDRPDTTSRTYTLDIARPSELAQQLQRLARPLLTPDDGSPYRPPTIEPIDDMRMLVVRAAAEQLATITQLVEQLDAENPADRQFQILSVRGSNPEGLIERAKTLYAERAPGVPGAGEVQASLDRASGSVIVRGRAEGVRLFGDAMTDAQRLLPPDRSTKFIDVRNVEASELVEPLRDLLASADPIDPSRAVPEPAVKVVEETNSLMITAEDAQHRVIADLVRRLDVVERGELPPLRLLQLRSADVNAIAQMLGQQYDSRPPADRATKPVQVRADAATGTLIVSAHPDLFDEIKGFVEQLNDTSDDGPERETFIFPLKVARAVDVAQAMDRLYPAPPTPVDRRGRPMPWLQEPKEVTVSADPSSNSLIIDAPTERRDSLTQLAETLDNVKAPPEAKLRTYRIVNADLNAVANMLRGLASRGALSGPAQPGQQKVDVVIETEPRSSTLIVAGDDTTFGQVDNILDDLTAVPIERGLRIVPIANAAATDVRERSLAIYDAQIAQIEGAGAVDVSVDEDTNSLEIVADNDAMKRFVRILEELQRQTGPAKQVRLIELRLADVNEVIGTLRELVDASETLRADGGPKPVFEPIKSTNSVMVAAQPAQFAIIEPLIRSLDNRQTAERPPLRILRLRSTDAQSIAQVLQRSFERRSQEDRARKPVEIEADPTTNTLIVSAHPDVLPEIESIIEDLNDAQAIDRDGREIRIFPLKVARAEELARTIDQMYPEPPMPRDRRGAPMPWLQEAKEVSVRADPATNSLIVDAPAARLSGFEQLVKSLDTLQVDKDVELRTYTVATADLNAVANTIRHLAQSGAFVNAGRTPITVNTEPESRTLVVSGPSAIFDRVESVINEVDGAGSLPPTVMRMYPLSHARADQLAETISGLLRTRLRESIRAAGDAPMDAAEKLVEVTGDRASNTLIISAPDETHAIAEQLIQALDTEAAAVGRASVRIVPLTFASADEVARTLNQAMGSMELPSGGRVQVLPAASSNALLLTGANADLDKVATLIEPLDVQPFDPEKPSIETFALEHADAQRIASTVERLLVDQQQTDPRILAMRMRYARGRLPDPPRIRVEAEARTNSLIVSGPNETIELSRAVIERLDQPPREDARALSIFTPANAAAERLADTVRRALPSAMTEGRRPLELTAEPSTGAVLVLGEPDGTARAMALLKSFDEQSPAMPMVELRSFALEHVEANAISGMLRGMREDGSRGPEPLRRAVDAGLPIPSISVQTDRESNRVALAAPAALMPLAAEFIETFDQQRASAAVETRVFKLSEGDAEGVASAIREALAAGAGPGERAPLVTAEPTSNTVVIAARADRVREAASIIEAMDQVAAEPADVGVRTIFLERARAETVAPIVERVLTKDDGVSPESPWWIREQIRIQRLRNGDTSDAPTIRVAAEPRLNAIVVSAPLATLELAEEVVSGLDIDPSGGPGGGRSIRVIPIRNADASEIASNVEAVFDDVETAGPAPTVRVDRGSNTLIVSASADQMRQIERLASDIDRATLTSGRGMRTIPIDPSRADAADVARTLQRLLRSRGGLDVKVMSVDDLLLDDEPAGEPSSAAPMLTPLEWLAVNAFASVQPAEEPPEDDTEGDVTIAVDRATNTLVIVGSSRVAERIAALASEIERELPAEPGSVRIVQLPDAVDANAVASVVNRTLDGARRAGGNNRQNIASRVVVTPDPQGNALIVWASDTDFRTVAELVRALATPSSAEEMTVKVYPLTNIDARSAERSVSDMLSPSPRGRQARRVREFDMTIRDADGGATKGTIDPSLVSVSADPSGASLIVTAPASAFDLIDRFVGLIDQSPLADRMVIRRRPLEHADAAELAGTIQRMVDAQRQGPGSRNAPRAVIAADRRTNALYVTASETQLAEVNRLIDEADAPVDGVALPLTVVEIEHARPSAVERAVREVLVGRDPARANRIQVSADDETGQLIVRATEEDIEEIRSLVDQIDVQGAGAYPVRSITLERADAGVVATQLQRFFQQRARVAGRRGSSRAGDAAIIGDRTSGTLVIAANDQDYQQIADLAAKFDAPAADRAMDFKVFRLETARASAVADTLQNIQNELQWERMYGRNQENAIDERFIVTANDRTNSILVFGEGDMMELMETVIAELDADVDSPAERIVRAIRVDNADLRAVERLVEQITADPDRPWWRGGPDPMQVMVEIDQARRLAILIGARDRVEEAAGYVEQLAAAATGEAQGIEVIPLRNARADRAASSLAEFFRSKARSEQRREDSVAIIGSREGNVLIVSAPPEDMELLNELIAQIDRPELGDDRSIEVYRLANAESREVAGTIRGMFPNDGPLEDRVIVTPQPSTNALIVSAPTEEHERIAALLDTLERGAIADAGDVVRVQLESADARDVASVLRQSIPDTLRVEITPDPRTNALLITGSEEAIELVRAQIADMDQVVDRQPVAFRRFVLKHADDRDLVYTLEKLLRSRPRGANDPEPRVDYSLTSNSISVLAGPDEMEFIEDMVTQLDVAQESDRITEFVSLEYADAKQIGGALGLFFGSSAPEAQTAAEREVAVYSDAAGNSLVITGPESVFGKVRALIEKLDTEDYDTSNQLVVMPLKHADALSVARALNEGFRAPLEQQVRREEARRNRTRSGGRTGEDETSRETVLVSADETPSVSAEPQTNSLVIFASRRDLERIRTVVESLDVPDYQRLPEPRLITVTGESRARELAESVRRVFLSDENSVGASRTVIVGDDDAGVLVIRATDEAFEQIQELAWALMDEAETDLAGPRVVRVNHSSAARLRRTLLAVFRPMAERRGEAFTVEVDPGINALVISASDNMHERVDALIGQLDVPEEALASDAGSDGAEGDDDAEELKVAGSSPMIVELDNVSPGEMQRMLTELGVTQAPNLDRPGIVSEQVTLVPMRSRSAIAVVAGPADRSKLRSLIETLDAAPGVAGQTVAIERLELADANQVVNLLDRMLRPQPGDARTDAAAALAEQVRRLSVDRQAQGEPALELDLAAPIRLIPDTGTNSVLIASTPSNVAAVSELVEMLDELPVGDAVVVRIFPLENAIAERVRAILGDLFRQGAGLGSLPGAARRGVSPSATGRALASEVAVSVDDRTNAILVAGPEEAVALAEVLVAQLDTESDDHGWVEASLIELTHADSVTLARKLREVLVEGIGRTPEAVGLQRQIGRLRLMLENQRGGDWRVESDIFAPLAGLSITPEENLNALIVTGTPSNIDVVRELTKMLDIERASASNSVRVIPLEHADAGRVASVIDDVFEGRSRLESMRPEDELVISVDERTNALVVSTSPRSFAIVDGLITTLDAEESRFAVGLHVIPVPGSDVRDLAPKIQNLMRDRLAATRRRGGVESPLDVFRIEPVPQTDSLIVASSDENLELVHELIDALTTSGDAAAEADQFELIPIETPGRAAEIADTINELYVRRENDRRGQRVVSVAASDRQNALIVSGTAQDIDAIRDLVGRLDVAEAETVQEVKRLALRAADAFEGGRLLEELLSGRASRGGGGG